MKILQSIKKWINFKNNALPSSCHVLHPTQPQRAVYFYSSDGHSNHASPSLTGNTAFSHTISCRQNERFTLALLCKAKPVAQLKYTVINIVQNHEKTVQQCNIRTRAERREYERCTSHLLRSKQRAFVCTIKSSICLLWLPYYAVIPLVSLFSFFLYWLHINQVNICWVLQDLLPVMRNRRLKASQARS